MCKCLQKMVHTVTTVPYVRVIGQFASSSDHTAIE